MISVVALTPFQVSGFLLAQGPVSCLYYVVSNLVVFALKMVCVSVASLLHSFPGRNVTDFFFFFDYNYISVSGTSLKADLIGESKNLEINAIGASLL